MSQVVPCSAWNELTGALRPETGIRISRTDTPWALDQSVLHEILLRDGIGRRGPPKPTGRNLR